MNKVYCILAALTGLFLIQLQSFAQFSQPGELDTTFNFGGVPHSFFLAAPGNPQPGAGANNNIFSLALQPDGKLLIGGNFSTYNGAPCSRIARLNVDGSFDATFNSSFGANNNVLSLIPQPDGKVLIGGQFTSYQGISRNRLARLNANGSLDTTFNPGTGANNSVWSIALQPDGKALIGGSFTNYNGTTRNYLVRLNADGNLDAAFNTGTGANGTVFSLALQPDGKVLIGGFFTTYNGTPRNNIARLNIDGSLDTTFNPGTGLGGVTFPEALTLVLQPDGKVLIGGFFTTLNGTPRNNIARLNANGSLDSTFNPGTGANGSIETLALQPDGKVMIGGVFSSYNGTPRNNIARLNVNGSLDATFNPGSGGNNIVQSLAIQPDGKVVIVGNFTAFNGTPRNRITRLNSSGSVDTPFNPVTGANDAVRYVALQPDGKVLIGGFFTTYNGTTSNYLARLTGNGDLDSTFNSGTGAGSTVETIALQPDGKVLIGGFFTTYNGTPRNRIARLNADGSLDATFNPGTGVDGPIEAFAVQPNGKVLIGGLFTTYNGTPRNRIARLNADGSLDATFNPGTGANSSVWYLALQPDGKVLIGGQFSSYNDTITGGGIARLNTNGSLDVTFNSGTGVNGIVESIALQPDGKVLIAGSFTSYNATSRNGIARLYANGSLDASFNPGAGADNTVKSLVLQPDGKVVIGGNLTTFNGTPCNRIARLNAYGRLDTTFNSGFGANDWVRSLVLQSDGKVLIGGDFTFYNIIRRLRIARLFSPNCIAPTNTTDTSSLCSGNTKSLTGTSGGSWFIASGPGSIIGSTYTAAASGTVSIYNSVGGCTSPLVTFTVNPLPSFPTVPAPAAICAGNTATITPTAGGANYRIYAASTGGIPLAGGNGVASFTTPTLSSATVYHVASVNSAGCESSTRTPVTVIVIMLPLAPTVSTPVAICAGNTATITPTAGGANYRFYAASSGGSPLAGGNGVTSFNTPSLFNTTTYHVASVSSQGCESNTRTPVSVTVNPLPPAPMVPAPTEICSGTNTSIVPTAGGSTYRFYSAATGGSPLAGGNGVFNYVTPILSSNTTYFVSSLSATGCESSTRTAVTVLVNLLPNVVVTIVNDTLRASIIIGAYQWLLDGVIIPGANSSIFVPTVSGNYSAQVTSPQGCVGVSAPVVFIVSGSETDLQNPSTIDVFPNPIGEELHVKSELHFDFVVTDILGNVVLKGQKMAGDQIISTERLASGSYFLQVISERGILNKKLIKQ